MDFFDWTDWFKTAWFLAVGVFCGIAILNIENPKKRKMFSRIGASLALAMLAVLWWKELMMQ